jgi:MFS family permease
MNLSQSLVRFLGLKKNILVLLGMVIFVGLGEKMAERFLPLYLVALGGGALSVGLLNGMDNLLSALYSFPGGYASDRLGYKRALALFNVLAMLGFLIVIVFPSWPAVLVGSAFFLSWTAISLPATISMIAHVLPNSKRTMGVSMHSLVRRVPMALGPVLGGVMIAQFGEITGVRLAFVIAFILGAFSLWFQQIMLEDDKQRERKAETSPLRVLAHMSPALRQLLLSDILVRFCEQIPYAFVVLWCVNIVGISPVQFGVLTAIEMAVAMLVYIPVAYLADKTTKKPFVVITFGFFTLFPLVLLFSRSFWTLVLAFVVRGLKEFGEPTRKALILDLAPQGQEASMFGAYYLTRDLIVSVAAFGGAFLWNISPAVNFLTAAGFGLLGLILFALFGSDLKTPTHDKEVTL